MRPARVILTALAATVAVVAASTASLSASAAPALTSGVSAPGPQVSVRADASPAAPTAVVDTGAAGKVATATFTVTYTGFTPQARAAFQRAVDYWATQVTSSVPITVDARFSALGAGILGSAGPGSIWRDFPGAPKANTWYVDAIANKHRGAQLSPAADIRAQFSSAFSNWFYGTGSAPAGTYDFQTVVTHELGHGLGFLGLGSVSGGVGSVRTQGFPTAYDRVTELGSGKKLLSYPDGSSALAAALQSGNVVIDTTAIRNANGGQPAKLYAPSSWQSGSSYSHLDEATFRRGSADSLMTPQLASGETVRTEGPVTRAVFKAAGW